MTNREVAIQQLEDLNAKLNRLNVLNKQIEDRKSKLKKTPSFCPLAKADLLPTNNAKKYLESQVGSRLDYSDRKALVVKILFWLFGIAAVLLTGYFIWCEVVAAGKTVQLAFPGAMICAALIGFLAIKFDWDRKKLIVGLCVVVFAVTAYHTHLNFEFLIWIFFGVVLAAIGLIALCMHFDGWSDTFYDHSRKRDKQEDKIRQTKEYQEKAELDSRNIEENKKREKAHRQEYEEKIKLREQQLLADIRTCSEEKAALEPVINQMGILSPGDFPKIDRILEKLKGMRADSVKEALQLCDTEDLINANHQKELSAIQFQVDLERMERQQKARQDADAQFNQAMHHLKVEREQRRQTDELERIRKELEK